MNLQIADNLPYNADEFNRVSLELRQRNITKVLVKTSMLWKMTAGREVVQALETALMRVARKAGFTCVIKEIDPANEETIMFYRPSDPDYKAFLKSAGRLF